jgi:integrase/recombinase XerD
MENPSMKRRPRSDPPTIADDAECATLWLATLSPRSRQAYARDLAKFREAVRSPLREVGIAELIAFQAGLKGAPATRARTMHAIRSLFRFARNAEYLHFDPTRVLRTPKVRPSLGMRYLSPEEVQLLFGAASSNRDKLLLQTLYYAGLRVSELCGLRWSDVRPRKALGSVQLSVLGKGSLPRQVPVPAFLAESLLTLRGKARSDQPVFVSRQGGALDRTQVFRIVKQCALQSGARKRSLRTAHRHSAHACAVAEDVARTLRHGQQGGRVPVRVAQKPRQPVAAPAATLEARLRAAGRRHPAVPLPQRTAQGGDTA